MSFQISLQPGDQQFSVESGQSVLEAALAAGFILPYGCRDGACGACKARIDSGHFDQGEVAPHILSETERAAGQALLCKTLALSDLTITVRSLARASDLPVKKLPGRVQSIERLADDVIVLKLRLPASTPFRFRAGQYIDFLIDGERRRSFSIANAPSLTEHLELHIRRIDGGHFTGHVFETLKARDILRFEGPFGSFGWSPDETRPAVLLAGGTGFAPIKSLVEELIERGGSRPLKLYWGSRAREGLYMDSLAREWAQRLPNFRYVPVLSEASEHDNWTGRSGLVHHAVMKDLPDLSAHEVYACGSPAMIDAARADFTQQCGLAENAFFADAFTFSSQ